MTLEQNEWLFLIRNSIHCLEAAVLAIKECQADRGEQISETRKMVNLLEGMLEEYDG